MKVEFCCWDEDEDPGFALCSIESVRDVGKMAKSKCFVLNNQARIDFLGVDNSYKTQHRRRPIPTTNTPKYSRLWPISMMELALLFQSPSTWCDCCWTRSCL